MSKKALHKVNWQEITRGLQTSRPNTALDNGCLQVAENVMFNDSVMSKVPGFARVSAGLPADHAYLLDGSFQYWRGRTVNTSSLVALNGAAWSLEVIFRMDAFPEDVSNNGQRATLIYKGSGTAANTDHAAANLDYVVQIVPSSGQYFVQWSMYNAIGATVVTLTDPTPIALGTYYQAALTYAGTTVISSFVGPTATVAPAVATAAGVLANPVRDGVNDLLIGAAARSSPTRLTDVVQFGFKGVIQDVRYWSDERTAGEIASYWGRQLTSAEQTAETNLIAYYPLTKAYTTGSASSSTKGTAGDSTSAPNAPQLVFRSMLSMGASGKDFGYVVPTPVIYRKPYPDTAGEYDATVYFLLTMVVRPAKLINRATLFHYVHCPTSASATSHDVTDTTGTSTSLNLTADATGQILLEMLDTGGQYRFRAVAWFNTTAPAERAASIVSATNLAINTTYTVTVAVSYTGTVSIYVDSDAVQTSAMGSIDTANYSVNTPATVGLDPRKYAMSIGRAINTTQQTPDGVDVTYNLDRTFYGTIGQVVIAQPTTSSDFQTIHKYLQSNTIARNTVSSLAIPIISAWPFNDTALGVAEDVGLASNNIQFKFDPDYTLGHTTITTNGTSPPRGLFDHFYRTSNGLVHRYVAVTDGAAYDFDLTTGAFTLLDDGLRNDDGNRAVAMRYQDSLIMCFGGHGHNHQLWKDTVYRLDIVPPQGVIPFGLTHQIAEEAKLFTGKYRYTFTYWSGFIGKRSPHGPILEVDIKSEKANIAFGDQAEISQTHAQSEEALKFPQDWSGYGTTQKVHLTGYLNGTETGPASDPAYDILPLTTGSGPSTANAGYFEESTSVQLEEFEEMMILRSTRAFLDRTVEGRFRFKSNLVGSSAKLIMTDTGTILTSANGFGFVSALPATFTGTGNSSHGLTLPRSSDPQVTHLEVWRTNAFDGTFRLVARLPNGTTGYVDALEDALNTGEILNIADGAPPPVRMIVPFNGRALFVLDDDNPQRAYFSSVGEPWNVPPQNVVDFLDGSTAEITGVGVTENAVALFKNDTTFVLTPPTNSIAPFDVQVRTRAIGCVAPYGIVNVNEALFYPGELGFYGFDMTVPRLVSGNIDPTWESVPPEAHGLMFAVHDKANRRVVWFHPTTAAGLGGCDAAITLNYESGANGNSLYGWATLTNLGLMKFAGIIQGTADADVVYTVDVYGNIYLWSSGDNYGPGALTSVGPLAVTSGTTSSIVIPKVTSYATLPYGYKGLILTKVTTAGARETRMMQTDSLGGGATTTCSPFGDWTVAPTSTDVVYVGSIEATATFGEISPAGGQVVQDWFSTFLRQTAPDTLATLEFTFQGTKGMAATEQGQQYATISNQKTNVRFATACRGRNLIAGVRSLGPNKPFTVRDFAMLWGEPQDVDSATFDPVT